MIRWEKEGTEIAKDFIYLCRYWDANYHLETGLSVTFFPMAQHPPVDQGFLIIEASQSYSDTPHSVGLLWTSDQPDAETST